MSNRNLVTYLEKDLSDDPSAVTLEVERSASGQPCLLFTIKYENKHASEEREMTIVVEDADQILEPALAWARHRREARA